MDQFIYLGAFIAPVMTVPQLAKIFMERRAAGLSLITWVSYFLGAIFWIVYGWVHREKPIIIANLSLGIIAGLISIGILLYG